MSSDLLAQLFSILALIFYVVSTQIDEKHRVLFWRTLYSTVYAVQYLFLGAFSGVISSVTPIIRNLVYDKQKKVSVFWIVFFSILTLVPGLFFCENLIDLLPLIHTVLCTIFIGVNNLTIFRISQVLSAPLVLIYNGTVGAWVGIGIVLIQFTSSLIGVIRFDLPRFKKYLKKQKNRKKGKTKKRR